MNLGRKKVFIGALWPTNNDSRTSWVDDLSVVEVQFINIKQLVSNNPVGQVITSLFLERRLVFNFSTDQIC